MSEKILLLSQLRVAQTRLPLKQRIKTHSTISKGASYEDPPLTDLSCSNNAKQKKSVASWLWTSNRTRSDLLQTINFYQNNGKCLNFLSHNLTYRELCKVQTFWKGSTDFLVSPLVQSDKTYSAHFVLLQQSSYLSRISRIILVEKKLSCGEILGHFETLWEILGNLYALSRVERLCPKIHLWRKNDKYEVCVTAPAAPISLVVRAERPKRRWRQTLWTNPEPTWALIMKMKSKVIFFLSAWIFKVLWKTLLKKYTVPKFETNDGRWQEEDQSAVPRMDLTVCFHHHHTLAMKNLLLFTYNVCQPAISLVYLGLLQKGPKIAQKGPKSIFFYGRKRHFLLSSLFLWKVDLLVELHVSWDSVHLAWRNVFFHGNEI